MFISTVTRCIENVRHASMQPCAPLVSYHISDVLSRNHCFSSPALWIWWI